jgi:hypothetical protein
MNLKVSLQWHKVIDVLKVINLSAALLSAVAPLKAYDKTEFPPRWAWSC